MTAAELREWEAFEVLEPFGQDWMRSAMLATLLANGNRDPEKQSEPYSLMDFMPGREDLAAEDDPDREEIGEEMDLEPEREPEQGWKNWKAIFTNLAEATKEKP